MRRFSTEDTSQFFIFAFFIGLVGISPSLKVIPQGLIAISLHDSQRLLELLFIGLILLESIVFGRTDSNRIVGNNIRYAFYALAVIAIISSCLALSPRHAMIESSLFAGLLYLATFVARMYRANSMQFVKRITYVLWGGILLSMIAFYVGYFTATIFKTPVVWPGPITGFNNVRFFNQYQLWTLGLITLPLLTFNFKNSPIRYWLHLGAICWWVLLFHTASRGALLSWALGIVMIALIYRKLAWPFIRLQLVYITSGFLSFLLIFELIPFLRKFEVVTGTIVRDTTSDRLALWSQSLNLIQEHPIFGIGPMHFAWYSPISAHPHNSVLQIMVEWGLPAAFLLLAVTCYGLFCWLRKFNMAKLQSQSVNDRNFAIILFFTAVTNATYSLVDGVIVMPISQIMMFTCIGLMLGYYSKDNITANNGVQKTSLLNALFTFAILAALVWSTLPEIMQNASGNEKKFSMGYEALGPRIWLEFKE